MSSTPRRYNFDDPKAAALAATRHGIYAIRDSQGYSEKLQLFKTDPGREEIRAELGVVLYDMFQAWKAHLFGLRNDPEAVLTAPVNKSMATYLNLLFRLVDTWPKGTAKDYGAELERIRRAVDGGETKEGTPDAAEVRTSS